MGGNWARTGSKVLALTVVALLSVCPMFLPQASARTYPTTIMRTFKDGNITENMDFTGPGKQTTRVRMDEGLGLLGPRLWPVGPAGRLQ